MGSHFPSSMEPKPTKKKLLKKVIIFILKNKKTRPLRKYTWGEVTLLTFFFFWDEEFWPIFFKKQKVGSRLLSTVPGLSIFSSIFFYKG